MRTDQTTSPLRGLAHVTYWADDVAAARDWYSELLGIEAYFQRPDPDNPAYVEFRLGDYQHELGITDRRYAPPGPATGAGHAQEGSDGAEATDETEGAGGVRGTPGAARPGGAVVSWHVDDLSATRERLLAMGAREYEPVVPREAGFVTASVVDPFGNILGLIHSPHYREVLAAAGPFQPA